MNELAITDLENSALTILHGEYFCLYQLTENVSEIVAAQDSLSIIILSNTILLNY